LSPTPWTPGDVVARVALERQEVRDALGWHAELLDHRLARVAELAHRIDDVHARRDQLHQVLVGREQANFPAALLGLGHERRDDVIGLDPGLRDHRPAHRFDQRPEVRHLDREVLRRRRPRRLVSWEDLVAKALSPRVEYHRHPLRPQVVVKAHQHAREDVDGTRRHALGGREPDFLALSPRAVHQAVMGAENVSVPVHDVQPLHGEVDCILLCATHHPTLTIAFIASAILWRT
jgi:hypothetical protein